MTRQLSLPLAREGAPAPASAATAGAPVEHASPGDGRLEVGDVAFCIVEVAEGRSGERSRVRGAARVRIAAALDDGCYRVVALRGSGVSPGERFELPRRALYADGSESEREAFATIVRKLWPTILPAAPDLRSYDWIVVNTSAGKDSQAMLDVVCALAREAGVLDRVVAVHCDLGRVEWQGTPELAARQAAHYGVRFEIVSRRQGDLLSHVRQNGRWPGFATRYCTSDHKRGPVLGLLTRLVRERRSALGFSERGKDGRAVRILQCMAGESSARAKLVAFERDHRASNTRRTIDRWLPLHAWTLDEVWARIVASGVPHHPAYDAGMPRLSCSFCIYAPRSALLLAGTLRPDLLAEYAAVEAEIGHRFRQNLSLVELQAAIQAGEQPSGPIESWEM